MKIDDLIVSKDVSIVEAAKQLEKTRGKVLAEGRAIGQKIGAGPVRIVADASEMDRPLLPANSVFLPSWVAVTPLKASKKIRR